MLLHNTFQLNDQFIEPCLYDINTNIFKCTAKEYIFEWSSVNFVKKDSAKLNNEKFRKNGYDTINNIEFNWQSSYRDHIIRNETEFRVFSTIIPRIGKKINRKIENFTIMGSSIGKSDLILVIWNINKSENDNS